MSPFFALDPLACGLEAAVGDATGIVSPIFGLLAPATALRGVVVLATAAFGAFDLGATSLDADGLAADVFDLETFAAADPVAGRGG